MTPEESKMLSEFTRSELEKGEAFVRCSALVLLHARWLESARTMDALADECADLCEDSDAAECRERARTFRECAADLEREWAGMKENDLAHSQKGRERGPTITQD